MKFNPALEKLKPYKAGPSLAEIRERFHQDRISEMAANEVPWGPFPEVVDALASALGRLNRYPDGSCSDLKAILADRLAVRPENLCFGNGSCELLMLLGQALLTPQQHAVFPHPSFVMYKAIALASGGRYTAVPLKDLEMDLDAMEAAVGDDTSLVVLCNPNNPTGTYIEPHALKAFLQRVPEDVVVVLDEAYIEFVEASVHEETAGWVTDFKNLVVLRTFSKIYGLAGLRIGYAIADPEIIQELDKVRQPFNVDSLAQIAAVESLKHPERVVERRRIIAAEKQRVAETLTEMGVTSRRGEANFLLVDVRGMDIPGPEVGQELMRRGILTRSGYAMDCPGWIRVTIGTTNENDAFMSAMRDIRAGKARSTVQVEDAAVDAGSLSPES